MQRLERNIQTEKEKSSNEAIDLWVVSFLILFFELAIIRWIPSNISLLSYFSNIVLISCFLGLGAGCVLKSQKNLLTIVGIAILLLFLLTKYLHQFGVQLPLPGETYFFDGPVKGTPDTVQPAGGDALNWYVESGQFREFSEIKCA